MLSQYFKTIFHTFLLLLTLLVRQGGGDRWNSLFRFCLYLRSWPDGCDAMWIKGKGRSSRVAGWYQRNLSQLAALRREQDPGERQGARSSRFQRWVSQGLEQRQKISGDLTQPVALESLYDHLRKTFS